MCRASHVPSAPSPPTPPRLFSEAIWARTTATGTFFNRAGRTCMYALAAHMRLVPRSRLLAVLGAGLVARRIALLLPARNAPRMVEIGFEGGEGTCRPGAHVGVVRRS